MMITTPADIEQVSFAIRDAVAPVFLLTGIGSLLSVLVNRLGRAVDRARTLNALTPEQRHQRFEEEFALIVRRTALMRWTAGLLTFAGLCVSISIMTIFIGMATRIDLKMVVLISFIISMCSLICGLLCFLREVILASQEVIAPRHTGHG
jgi:hypothetical protein